MTTTPVLGDRLAGPWYRVVSITARRYPDSAGHDFIDVLPAALTAARRGRPFAAGWLCRGAGAPLELITNSGPAIGHGGALLFPPGARGVPASRGWLAAWESLVWAVCPGRQAPALAGSATADPERGQPPPALFESALTSLVGRPFGWLVVAEPTGQLDGEAAGLRAEVNVLGRRDEEGSRYTVERAERRLAELDAYREAGLWNVRVLAGAPTPDELALLAPVLVGSVELSRHPYRLSSGQDALRMDEALLANVDGPGGGARVPFPATAGVLAALTGVPRQELPGLRVIDAGRFDLTSETAERADPAGAGIGLGVILDGLDRAVGELQVPLATLNRHAFVTGATGAGKSQTVRHLLEQLTAAGLPWLVIEPVKSEYPAVAGRLATTGQVAAVTVVNPADPDAVPLSVNPLAPEPGYPVQAHIDMVRALFLAAFDADEPFPQIMAQALQRVYEGNGWDVVTGGGAPGSVTGPAVPTLAELQHAALAVIEDVGYGRELQADVRGFVDVRLRSLRTGSAGRFFEGGHPADIAGLLRRNVVVAIEDVANDEDKAFLMGTLIIRIVEHLRLRARAERADGLRHVIVIEEAHRLLRAQRGGRAGAHAVEMFAQLLAEIRAYGEGLVIAEQIPSKLIADVVKNTALKVVHRLPARDDRDLVGAAMNLDEDQSRQVVSLPPGVAAVFADGMDRPVRVKVPYGGPRERALPGPPPPVAGRRSAACGPRCTGERACTGTELRRAGLLAASGEVTQTWLRLWVEVLILAFLTGRGIPAAPGPLRRDWPELPGRLRECLLATVIDRAVTSRGPHLRPSFDPARLAACAAGVALRLLDSRTGAGTRPGPSWVIPQLRWLHELERVCPLGGQAGGRHRAPPLDYDLPGLADWPGMQAGHRLRALRRHPLSMELARNQVPAWTVLLGDDDQRGFCSDVAAVAVGLPASAQLRAVAEPIGAAGWLGVVLSWPRRFVAGRPEWADAVDGDEWGSGAG